MRRHLGTARPVQWVQNRKTRVAFHGEQDRVDFLAVMPAWPDRAGLYMVRLAREDDRLVLVRRIVSADDTAFHFDEAAERTVLADGVAGLGFHYFGRAAGVRRGGWHPAWREETALPRLVTMEVRFAGAASVSWPPLVVAPRIGPQPR